MTNLYGVTNNGLAMGSPEYSTGPYVRSRTPDIDALNVAVSANVLLTIAALLPRTVNLATVTIEFRVGTGAWVTVYTASAFQAGYAGSVSGALTNDYESYRDFVINPAADFAGGALISVRVTAQDDAANSIFPPELYPFTTALAPVVPDPDPVVAAPFFVHQATPVGSNVVRVYFSAKPQQRSSLSRDDALCTLDYTVSVVSGTATAPVAAKVTSIAARALPSFADAWSADLVLDRQLVIGTVYRLTIADTMVSADGALIDPDRAVADFPGIMPTPPRRRQP